MRTIREIIMDMDAKEFEELVMEMEDTGHKNVKNLAKYILNTYFDFYKNDPNPIQKSFEDDPDDFWDAREFLVTHLEMHEKQD